MPSIGMYGINVKKKIIVGNKATKKLKAIEDALVVIDPFHNPLRKNTATSYKGSLSKPGKTIFFEMLISGDRISIKIFSRDINILVIFNYLQALRLISRLFI
jgi:hypothetical protein